MVGAAAASQSQSQSQSQISQTQTSAEEEALKRNTDCVYFLASPLTCKKGSECEYRHSDVARLNPRDCWYWLNGNCLNVKCGFRHPPLDGLLGTQTPTSFGTSQPQVQTAAAPAAQFPAAFSKQGVPCVFFQKGQCLKGDWCSFLHVPSFNGSKSTSMTGIAPAAEPATHKKAGLEKSAQEKALSSNVAKPVKVPPQAKPALEVEPAPPRSEFSRRIPLSSGSTEVHRYSNFAPLTNGNPVSSIRVQQPHLLEEAGSMSNKDAEEVSREPSPGFDVLVDDEHRDSDYYPSEDQYGMARERKGRNEYDMVHPSDYDTEIGNERYQDSVGYDSRDQFKGQFAWENRTSSERSSYHERRPYARSDGGGQVDESDLRHRLAKHKKPNGLRSVISHEHARERRGEDRNFLGFRRDEHNLVHENTLSSRLRGRLRLPGRSSSPSDKEAFRGADRDHGRSSAHIMTNQGRIRDRIKGMVEDTFNNGGRNQRVLHSRRDLVGDDPANFAGPKSLAELKNRKNAESSAHHAQPAMERQSLGKRKYLTPNGQSESGTDLSFDGPKPLQEILKRKRGETIGTVHSGDLPDGENVSESNNSRKERNEMTNNETNPYPANNKSSAVGKTDKEESNPAPLIPGPQSVEEAEDGLIIEDGAEQESEAYEQGDGEYDYEQEGGEDFQLYDGETGDGEAEYVDEDDDDDDFAKQMGVMYS